MAQYSKKAQEEIRKEMHHYKEGEWESPQQAIAVGLTKARKEGAKVSRKKK